MRTLLLFALLCIVTLWILRRLQSGNAGRAKAAKGRRRPAEAPRVPDDEIVDVPYEDCPRPEEGGERDAQEVR